MQGTHDIYIDGLMAYGYRIFHGIYSKRKQKLMALGMFEIYENQETNKNIFYPKMAT